MVFQQLLDDLSLWLTPAGLGQQTPEFFELVKNLAISKSRQAQSTVIKEQAKLLKTLIKKPNSHKRIYEYLIRAMYCEMLGFPIPECYIQVIGMTQRSNVVDKRLGYMCASLFLSGGHELQILLSNSIQKELDSLKALNCGLALDCYSSILDLDSFNSLLPWIEKNLKHGDPFVRKKALIVLYSALKYSIEVWPSIEKMLQAGLVDSDLSVVYVALASFEYVLGVVDGRCKSSDELGELLQEILMTSLSMAPLFLKLLQNILDKRIPRSYIYKLQPAPWIQVRLLKILSHLSWADQSVSDGVQELLSGVLLHTVSFSDAGSMTLSEIVKTVCVIDACPKLIEAATRASVTFVVSSFNNFRYLGLTLLDRLVLNHAKFVEKYQAEIGGCLQCHDDLIRSKALVLLGRVCNERNVDAIVECMLTYLKEALDWCTRSELIFEVIELARAYSAGREEWAMSVAIRALVLGGDAVLFETARMQLQLMMKDGDRRKFWNTQSARTQFKQLVMNRDNELNLALLKLVTWCLGEYGSYEQVEDEKKEKENLDQIQEIFYSVSQKLETRNICVRLWIVISLLKIFIHIGKPLRDEMNRFLNDNKNSSNTQLAWICQEFIALQNCVGFRKREDHAITSDELEPSVLLNDITQQIIDKRRHEDKNEKIMDGARFLSKFSEEPQRGEAEDVFEMKQLQKLFIRHERNTKESVSLSSMKEPATRDEKFTDLARFSRRKGHVWSEDQF